jgi:acetyltransferase
MRTWHQALFTPRRIALVGASAKPGKLGRLFMQNLLAPEAKFAGEVIAVHPTETDIFGRQAYPRLRDIPGGADLAVIVTPPAAAVDVIEDCVAARVPVAVFISGGFAEVGAEGRALQDRVANIAREGGVRVIGPNCFGVINVGYGLNASLAIGVPKAGGISLVTQSGAYGMAAFTRSQEDGIGFAKVIAPGNKIDLDEVEILRFLGEDPETRVIALLLESIGDGRALIETAQSVAARKPVIVLKTGRGRAAQRAAASHTAALASDHVIARAAFRQAGIRVVDDGLALLDAAAALDWQPPLTGGRIGVITNSGGTGVELSDLLEEHGLSVPALSEDLQKQIRPWLPAYGSPRNPVDVTTDWQRFPDMYGMSLRLLLYSEEIDAVIVVLLQRGALIPEVTERIIAEVDRARLNGCQKPVHVCWVAPKEADDNRRKLIKAGIPCHPWAARTAQALAVCRTIAHHPLGSVETSSRPPDLAAETDWLAADAVFRLLKEAGVPVGPWRLAETADSAVAAARDIGFPVVLKAERSGLVHKSDVGAVRLGLAAPAAVAEAFRDFEDRFGPGPALVQAQVRTDLELFVGGVRDRQFGPLLTFGLGGIWVEVMRDVAMRLAPFDEDEALSMIAELRGQALFGGFRGRRKVDKAALARMLQRLSRWFASAEWVAELDINPLAVDDDRFVVLDARIRMAPSARSRAKAPAVVQG